MCLIIASKEGNVPDADLMKRSYDDNPHGWGVMWVEDGAIHVVRGLKYASMVKAMKRVEGKPYVLHTRWATHGSKTVKNCHPFKVDDDLWIAHNGIIQIETPVEDRSDTWHWAQAFSQVVKDYPWVMEESYRPKLIDYVEKWVGVCNKVVMLRSSGDILIANESAGVHYEGMWLSNTNSLWEQEPYDYSYNHRRNYNATSYQDVAAVFASEGDEVDLHDHIAVCEYCPTATSRLYKHDEALICRSCYIDEIMWQAKYKEIVDADDELTEEDIQMIAATSKSLERSSVTAMVSDDDVPF